MAFNDETGWIDTGGSVSSADMGGFGSGLADVFKSAVTGWSSVEVAKARLNSQYSPYGYYTAGQRGVYAPGAYGAGVGGINPLILLGLAAVAFIAMKD